MKPIKTITKYLAQTYSEDESPDQKYRRSLMVFNENNDLLEDTLYDLDGRVEQKTVYKYDDAGNMISQTAYLSENEISEKFEFTYDNEGRKATEKIIYADGSVSVKSVERKGMELLVSIHDEDGEFEGREIHLFNDNKQIIEETIWDEEDIIQEKNIYQYDENQNLRVKTEYGIEEEFVARKKIEYDERGNALKIASLTEKDNIISLRESLFNEDNKLVEQHIDGYVMKYRYDDNGRLVQEETFNQSGNQEVKVEYFYDGDGLMTKSVSFQASEYFVTEPGFFPTAAATFISAFYEYTTFDQ